MRPIRKALLAALVWLTAASALFAGVPQFICRCASENNAEPGFKTDIGTTGACFQTSRCRCNGNCCHGSGSENDQGGADASVNRGESRGCCGVEQSQTAMGVASSPETRLSGTGCRKTLLQPEWVLTFPQKTPVWAHEVSGQLLLYTLGCDVSQGAGYLHLEWQKHPKPPPSDLVITLLHLLV